MIEPRLGILQRVRRNHALEHATIHMLSSSCRGGHVAGRSDGGGYVIYGDVDTAALAQAAERALLRLQKGEASLAVHPHCGTNLASGILAAMLLGRMAPRVFRSQPARWAAALLGMAAGLALSGSIGHQVQAHVTTSPDLRDARIAAIRRECAAGLVRHRIVVRHAGERA